MTFRPPGKVSHCREQRLAHRREGVVDSGRHDRVNSPGNESIPLETAQRHGEHALADPIDIVQELSESATALAQAGNHEH